MTLNTMFVPNSALRFRAAVFGRQKGRQYVPWALATLFFLAAAAIPAWHASGQETAKEKEEIPQAVEYTLTTPADRVRLAVTYYPPIKRGRSVVPVVLLHQFKGSRRDYVDLALALQRAGHAVILPDLRGHGGSTTITPIVGAAQRLDPDRFRRNDFHRMALDDMAAIDNLVRYRNNEGDFNANRLCVVGAEMGATVALLYAEDDWNAHYQNIPTGQLVKALVLISPEWAFQGLGLQATMQHRAIRNEVSILIAVGGRQRGAVHDAKRIHGMLSRHRPEPPPNRVAEEKDLFYAELDTALQGTSILGQGLKLEPYIAQFINLRLVKAPKARDFGWVELKARTLHEDPTPVHPDG